MQEFPYWYDIEIEDTLIDDNGSMFTVVDRVKTGTSDYCVLREYYTNRTFTVYDDDDNTFVDLQKG